VSPRRSRLQKCSAVEREKAALAGRPSYVTGLVLVGVRASESRWERLQEEAPRTKKGQAGRRAGREDGAARAEEDRGASQARCCVRCECLCVQKRAAQAGGRVALTAFFFACGGGHVCPYQGDHDAAQPTASSQVAPQHRQLTLHTHRRPLRAVFAEFWQTLHRKNFKLRRPPTLPVSGIYGCIQQANARLLLVHPPVCNQVYGACLVMSILVSYAHVASTTHFLLEPRN
jgi:hypothetical protein